MPIMITMIGNLILALAAITAAVTDDFVGDANNRGVQFFYGEGVEQSYETAVEWWVKAAEGNNVHALFNLGTMYDQGKGVAQNYTQAMQLYERAAEQGHANSRTILGTSTTSDAARRVTRQRPCFMRKQHSRIMREPKKLSNGFEEHAGC